RAPRRPPGMNSALGSLLGLEDGIVEAPDTFWRATHVNSPRHIAAIAAEYSTLVEDDQFVFPQQFGGRLRVGPCGTRPGSHNGIEGRAASTALLNSVFNLRGEI